MYNNKVVIRVKNIIPTIKLTITRKRVNVKIPANKPITSNRRSNAHNIKVIESVYQYNVNHK